MSERFTWTCRPEGDRLEWSDVTVCSINVEGIPGRSAMLPATCKEVMPREKGAKILETHQI